MKYNSYLLILFIASSFQMAQAQFGVNLIYQLNSSSADWDAIVENDENLQNAGLGLSVDYWFRLKNYRVEFLGEAGFVTGTGEATVAVESFEHDWLQGHFLVNTNIYIFDIEGDCNCPTFGKDGGVFKKGFYLQAGAGVQSLDIENRANLITTNGFDIAPTLHGGLGLDIGIGEYFTITPWLRYTYRFPLEWSGLSDEGILISEGDFVESTSTFLQAGIRAGYRWDYKKKY